MTLLRGGAVDPLSVIIQILATLVIVFLALPLHELAHGWVAYKLGDPTAKYEGRLTLNPLASIDPMGAMFLLLFGIGWAKPVPIDSRYFKNPRSGVALTSLAGPAANLLASYVGCVIYYAIAAFAPYNAFVHYVLLFFSYFSFINAVLAVFNLVPLPPLDGSKILAALLSDLPEYVCLVFVYDLIEYKADARTKLAGVLKKYGSVVAFNRQEQGMRMIFT